MPFPGSDSFCLEMSANRDGGGFVEEGTEGEDGPSGRFGGAPVATVGIDALGVDEVGDEALAPIGRQGSGGGEVTLKGEELFWGIAAQGDGGGKVGHRVGGEGGRHGLPKGREVATREGEGFSRGGEGVAAKQEAGDVVGGGGLGAEPPLGTVDGFVGLLRQGERDLRLALHAKLHAPRGHGEKKGEGG